MDSGFPPDWRGNPESWAIQKAFLRAFPAWACKLFSCFLLDGGTPSPHDPRGYGKPKN